MKTPDKHSKQKLIFFWEIGLWDGSLRETDLHEHEQSHWWEAPNQEVILGGQTLWTAPDAHRIQPQIQQSVS